MIKYSIRCRAAYISMGIAALVALTACTVGQVGTALPRQSTGRVPPAVSAPTVPADLPVASWARDPCRLFTPLQLRSLGLTSATTSQHDQNSVMNGCEWNDSTVGSGVQLDVDWVTPLSHGLSDIYAQQRTAAYWQPLTVTGYPAVLTDTVDERADGTCRMDIGVTNSAVLDLAYQGAPNSNPCTEVQDLAAAVISSLKGKA